MTTSSDAEQYALTTKERARLGWMALALAPEMGPTRTARAIARLGAAERVFEASLTELEGAGLPARAAQSSPAASARLLRTSAISAG